VVSGDEDPGVRRDRYECGRAGRSGVPARKSCTAARVEDRQSMRVRLSRISVVACHEQTLSELRD